MLWSSSLLWFLLTFLMIKVEFLSRTKLWSLEKQVNGNIISITLNNTCWWHPFLTARLLRLVSLYLEHLKVALMWNQTTLGHRRSKILRRKRLLLYRDQSNSKIVKEWIHLEPKRMTLMALFWRWQSLMMNLRSSQTMMMTVSFDQEMSPIMKIALQASLASVTKPLRPTN